MTELDKINNEIIKKQEEQILDLKAHIKDLTKSIEDLRTATILNTLS